jgi:hypothetical protein
MLCEHVFSALSLIFPEGLNGLGVVLTTHRV